MVRLAGLAFAVVAIPIILLAGFYGVQVAHEDTATAVQVTNETETASGSGFAAGDNFTVDNSSTLDYSESITVYDENDTEMSEGTDYAWNESRSNGTVTVLAGGGLVNDSNASVSYTYYEHSQFQTDLHAYWVAYARWLPALVFVLGAVFVVGVAASLT